MGFQHPFAAPHIRLHHTLTDASPTPVFEQHCHNDFEAVYIISGEGVFFIEGAEYPILPHTVLLIPPLAYHYIRLTTPAPYERIVVNFDREVLYGAIPCPPLTGEKNDPVGGVVLFPEHVGEPMRAAFLDLTDAENFPSSESAEIWLRATLTKLLLLFARALPSLPTEERADSLITRVIRCLNAHLTEEISLDDLAKELYVSKFYLCHTFREQTGLSIFHYLTAKRIILAQQYLAQGLSATETAFQCGFRDYSTFYRAYRKITGAAPVKRERP